MHPLNLQAALYPIYKPIQLGNLKCAAFRMSLEPWLFGLWIAESCPKSWAQVIAKFINNPKEHWPLVVWLLVSFVSSQHHPPRPPTSCVRLPQPFSQSHLQCSAMLSLPRSLIETLLQIHSTCICLGVPACRAILSLWEKTRKQCKPKICRH